MHHAEFLRLREVQARCGNVSKATIYRWIKDYDFPAPVKIGPGTSAWVKTETEEWLQSRPRLGRPTCYSQQEIAEEVGYSRQAVGEFENLLRSAINGTGAENGVSSENEALTNLQQNRGDEEEEKKWMACHTQQQIAEAVDYARETIRDKIDDFGENDQLTDSAIFVNFKPEVLGGGEEAAQ